MKGIKDGIKTIKGKVSSFILGTCNQCGPTELIYTEGEYAIFSYKERCPVSGSDTNDVLYMIFNVDTGNPALDVSFGPYELALEVLKKRAFNEHEMDAVVEEFNERRL